MAASMPLLQGEPLDERELRDFLHLFLTGGNETTRHLLTHTAGLSYRFFDGPLAARLEEGDLRLQGWVYHIGPGTVTAYNEASRRFETTASL